MLTQWKNTIRINYKKILYKGTLGFVVTFLSGLFFGKENMMLAFVMTLGTNNYEKHLMTQPFYKILKAISGTLAIIVVAFIASQLPFWGILLNFLAIFFIVYKLISPYDMLSYKTFMMLYVFSQYSSIDFRGLFVRLSMTVFAMSLTLLFVWLLNAKNHSILGEKLEKVWEILHLQVKQIGKASWDNTLEEKCFGLLNEVAYDLYGTGHRNYLTTYQGSIQFHFYLLLSHFQKNIKQLHRTYEKTSKQATTEVLQKKLWIQLENTQNLLLENLKEAQNLNKKKYRHIYKNWKRQSTSQIFKEIEKSYIKESMRLNFAVRMGILLTFCLILARYLGFYKLIWAIIPVMSVTRPCYEDTKNKRKERFYSNFLACIIVGVLLNFMPKRNLIIGLIFISFYGLYCFSDYYHMSFFMSVISMCLATDGVSVNYVILHRIGYLFLGLFIVMIGAKIKPYGLQKAMQEMLSRAEYLQAQLVQQEKKAAYKQHDPHFVRQLIIHMAVMLQFLRLQNKLYQDTELDKKIVTMMQATTELGYKILI